MPLDSRFVLVPSLQEYFVDKDTGLPLAGGKVKFYQDNSRNTPKDVYKISGTPPNYEYVSLGSEITLSSVGTYQDESNNDILVYFFPYDGTPEESNNTIELYYITVESATEVPQFTREGLPNIAATETTVEEIKNYIPNGQFWTHIDIPETSTADAGEITEAVTPIAYGSWTFARPIGSTASDFVTFERFGAPVDDPSAYPRYACRVRCTSANPGDTYKDLRVRFDDVNKFASEDQEYTLFFSAQTNTGTTINADIVLIKNYGTGGSATDEVNLGQITIPAFYEDFNTPFTFSDNEGKTIGDDNDDYLEIALRFPVSTTFDVSSTDFVLAPNNVTIEEFPQTPNAEFLYQALPPPRPNPDGSDLYLSPILTKEGWVFDQRTVGSFLWTMEQSTPAACLPMDGQTTYKTVDYSSEGIPYARLQAKLLSWGGGAIPIWGCGQDFVNSYSTNDTAHFRITNNTVGTVTNFSDGAIPTGFTFTKISVGTNVDYQAGASSVSSNTQLLARCKTNGNVTNPGAGTSGFTVGTIVSGNTLVNEVITIIATSPAALASKYFTFSNTTTNFYMWFKVDGAGSDPAPGGTGIEVDLKSVYSAADVAQVVAETLSGFSSTDIIVVAGSSIAAGSYFNFYTQAGLHYVAYYVVDGVGSNPNVPSTIVIPIAINSADTAAQVCSKTILTLNSYSFGLLDARGLFPRVWNNGGEWDVDAQFRFSFPNSSLRGDVPGTIEWDDIYAHTHTPTSTPDHPYFFTSDGTNNNPTLQAANPGPNFFVGTTTLNNSGGSESRPVNFSVNLFIHL
jgi:hypothetical protein